MKKKHWKHLQLLRIFSVYIVPTFGVRIQSVRSAVAVLIVMSLCGRQLPT